MAGRVRDAEGRFVTPKKGGGKAGAAKRAMQKVVGEAWPAITEMLVKTAKDGDFMVTKWLWNESGLGQDVATKQRRVSLAKTLMDELKRQQEDQAKQAEQATTAK